MSLLNQVLQDLETRQRAPVQTSIRLATASAAPHTGADWRDTHWQERLRPGLIGMLVALALVVAAWVFQIAWETSQQVTGPAVVIDPVPTTPLASDTDTDAVPATITGVTETPGSPVETRESVGAPDQAPQETLSDSNTAMPEQLESALPDEPRDVVASVDPAAEQPPVASSRSNGAVDPAEAAAVATDFLPLRNVELPVEPVRSTRRRSGGEAVVRPRAPDSMTVARDAIASGELASAEKLLRRRLSGRPAELDARELLVGLLLRGDRSEEAMRQLETGLAYHPAHGNFILIMAQLQAAKGDTEAAIATLRRGAGIRAIRSQCLQMLGALQQQHGQYAAASESFRQLVAIEPSLANAWMGLALSLDAEGRAGAASAYQRALEIGGLPEATVGYARQRLTAME
ncbi:MAG: tetratricopeptide repeat protein [Gammaproteobacteria bacterium]|nr:tetratricopeptide repeat protein [Gammaproteobacteria bacterium]